MIPRLLLLAWALTSCGEVDDPDASVPATGCAASPEALSDCVQAEGWQDDIAFIAQERSPGSGHWQAVQDLCAQRFAELGLDVELHVYASGVNVIGRLQGRSAPQEQVLLSAHYDHIEGCQGADDNASGVAGLLESARVLSQARFDRSLVFACWDEEESGLIGARTWAMEAAEREDTIVTVFNYEMIGYADDTPGSQEFPDGLDLLFPDAYETAEANGFRGDFLAVVGDELSHEAITSMLEHGQRVGLPIIDLELSTSQTTALYMSDLQRSDHAAFWTFGFPAMMLTDTSEFRYDAYHCRDGDDVVDNLDPDFARRVVATTVAAVAAVAGLRGG